MKHASHHNTAIERLEARIAPAGIASVAFAGNVLTITGDDLDNHFVLTQDTSAGMIRIENFDTGFDPATQIAIKGGTTALMQDIAIPDFAKLIVKIDTKGGDDEVQIGNTNIGQDAVTAKALTVKTGAGVDGVFIENTRITSKGATVIKLSQGNEVENDLLALGDATFGGPVLVNFGDGNNEAYIQFGSSAAGPLFLRSTNGNDSFFVTDGTYGGLVALTGQGSDTIGITNLDITGAVLIDSSKGSDSLFVTMVTARKGSTIKLGADTPADTNSLDVDGYVVERAAIFLGGSGADDVTIDSFEAASAVLNLAGGNDDVTATDFGVPNFNMNLGDGDDEFTALRVSSATTNWNMGGGSDNFSNTDFVGFRANWNTGGGMDVFAGLEWNIGGNLKITSDKGTDDTLMLDPMTSTLPPKFMSFLDKFIVGAVFRF